MESINSPSPEVECKFSFSNQTSIPKLFSSRTVSKSVTVFRANREIDLVITKSTSRFRHFSNIFWYSGRSSLFRFSLHLRTHRKTPSRGAAESSFGNSQSEPLKSAAWHLFRWKLWRKRRLLAASAWTVAAAPDVLFAPISSPVSLY